MAFERDSHAGPVPPGAYRADAEARRAEGRVQVFNATRPSGLDGWTMDLAQYQAIRDHILGMLEHESDDDGTLLSMDVVAAAHDRFGGSSLITPGRLTDYVWSVKVDLEARCEIERIPRSSPERICLWRPES